MKLTGGLLVGLTVAAISATASAQGLISYANTTGGTVYQLNAPTSWSLSGGVGGGQPTPLVGAGPNDSDAWFMPTNAQAYWSFAGASLPPFGTLYAFQAYVSDYGRQAHDTEAIFTSNGPPGNPAWAGVPQSTPGWTSPDMGNYGGLLWLSNDGRGGDMNIAFNPNLWGGYAGAAVSGLRISTDGNFTQAPEPASILLLLLGSPLLGRKGR